MNDKIFINRHKIEKMIVLLKLIEQIDDEDITKAVLSSIIESLEEESNK